MRECYTEFKFHASLHDRDIPSLDEIMGVSSGESEVESSPEDRAMAEKMERYAMRKIQAGKV